MAPKSQSQSHARAGRTTRPPISVQDFVAPKGRGRIGSEAAGGPAASFALSTLQALHLTAPRAQHAMHGSFAKKKRGIDPPHQDPAMGNLC